MNIKIINGKKYVSKTQYKKDLRKMDPDLEPGETFDEWFDAILEANKEDGLVFCILATGRISG